MENRKLARPLHYHAVLHSLTWLGGSQEVEFPSQDDNTSPEWHSASIRASGAHCGLSSVCIGLMFMNHRWLLWGLRGRRPQKRRFGDDII